MYEYSRGVFYYETDRMGVVHHSNFIRWLEEARNSYFNDVNLAYVETESFGVMSPVTDIKMKFKHFAKFGDNFTVHLKMTQYTGVRFRMAYTVVNQNGEELLEAESAHAFIGENLRPVSLARAIPERHELMQRLMETPGPELGMKLGIR